MKRITIICSLAIASVVTATAATAASPVDRAAPAQAMEQHMRLMQAGNPGMERMMELMRAGNPGMAAMMSTPPMTTTP